MIFLPQILVCLFLVASALGKVKSESEVVQSRPTLCDPKDCSPPGSSIHGIFQARILEWVFISFSTESSWPRDRTWVSHIVGRCFTVWATREASALGSIANLFGLWEGNGTALQYSCLENPMDGEAWWAAVHGVTKSQIQLCDFPFTFYFHALEKEMATHSSVLAWRIPGTGEPGGLTSMESHGVGHNWSDLAAAACIIKEKLVCNKIPGNEKAITF